LLPFLTISCKNPRNDEDERKLTCFRVKLLRFALTVLILLLLINLVYWSFSDSNKASILPSAPLRLSETASQALNNDTLLCVVSERNLKDRVLKKHVVISASLVFKPRLDLYAYMDETVSYLKLDSPLSQNTLHYILNRFRNIEELDLNIDQICSGFQASPDEEIDSSSIRLNNLISLTLRNGVFCPPLDWGFDIETPILKNVIVSKLKLDVQNFNALYTFLSKREASIESITITDSFICYDETQDVCDINTLMFPNLKQLVVSKRVENESYFEID